MDSIRGLNFSIDSVSSDTDENIALENSIVLENNIALGNMATDPDTVFKALRLVPEFDGNPNILTRFIRICDQLNEGYSQEGNILGNLCLMNGILNKITGPAARTINANGIPESWVGIRNVLINNFSDQRDETALYNDLSVQDQGHSTPQEFYDKCQTLFSTIMTYVTLHETVATTIEAKRDLYKKLTMQSFVRGLKDPLGSRIRCMRPATIEQALEFVQEELNTIYLQQRNNPLTHAKPHPTQTIVRVPQPPVNPNPFVTIPKPFTFGNQMPMQFQRPSGTPPFKMNAQNPPRCQQAPPRMPSRTQQMFGALPPNYNARSNVFRLPPRPQTGPQPMSGVSHFVPRPMPTGQGWRNPGQPSSTNYNYFTPAGINFNDCTDYSEYENNYYTEYEPEYWTPEVCNYNDSYHYDPYYQNPQQTMNIAAATPDAAQLELDSHPQRPTEEVEDFQKTNDIPKPR